ncbi:MAG: flagellar hook-associated protein FlgK [Chloroflexi bacterium]|nr:flagellar hook-associated protein FlgK [Chloroflexota bacterium]
MISTFFGLDMALRALQAQQAGVDVTNHNVANANTDGFSRQRVDIAATTPYTVPGMNRSTGPGQIGTGAIAGGIQRARDLFLDIQYRTESGAQSNAAARQDALEQVEVVFAEPNGSGLSDLLSEYNRVWNQLAGDPSDRPVRATVIAQSAALTDGFNRAARQLTDIRANLDTEVQSQVTDANNLTSQIFTLNKKIAQVEMTGQRANDYRDERDLMLDRLAGLAQISVSENADGSVNVALGSGGGAQLLVDGLVGKTDLATAPNAGNSNFVDVTFGSGGPAALLGNAGIQGKLAARDTYAPSYLSQLNAAAANLITAVNTLHAAGYDQQGNTGVNFFTGTDAATIGINPAIAADPARIAAAGVAGQSGNNDVALQITKLRQSMSPPLPPGTPTTESAYNAMVAQLGTDNRAARNELDTQTTLVNLIQHRREATSGVSLDEETVNLLRYQRAYEAAARLLSAQDEMLDKLINGTGIVGR